MSIERVEVRVQIIFPNRAELVWWIHDQFEMGRHIPFLVIVKWYRLPMIHARIVKYVTQAELNAIYGEEEE